MGRGRPMGAKKPFRPAFPPLRPLVSESLLSSPLSCHGKDSFMGTVSSLLSIEAIEEPIEEAASRHQLA